MLDGAFEAHMSAAVLPLKRLQGACSSGTSAQPTLMFLGVLQVGLPRMNMEAILWTCWTASTGAVQLSSSTTALMCYRC